MARKNKALSGSFEPEPAAPEAKEKETTTEDLFQARDAKIVALEDEVAQLRRKLSAAESALASIENGDRLEADPAAVPVYLKVKLGRNDLKHFEKGACIGQVSLSPGIDLGVFMSCLWHGHAGPERPS